MGEVHNYLTGTYDIEILTSPTLRLEGVSVAPSSVTDLAIPTPGLANISKPKVISSASIFELKEGVLSLVCELNPNKINERILLMPGQYQLVIKPQNSIDYKNVKTKRFQIEAGQTTNINISN